MIFSRQGHHSGQCVADFHETTRLYAENHANWSRRVGYFNTNVKARDRLIDVAKSYTGRVIYKAFEDGDDLAVSDPLRERKSTRAFEALPLPMSLIGSLFAQAVMARDLRKGETGLGIRRRRPYPSAGAIYSVEQYVIGLDLAENRPLVAYASPQRRELILIQANVDRRELLQALGLLAEGSPCPAFAVVQTVDLERATRKYGERGYRFALIEAGAAAQTLCMKGLALGLASTVWGGHHDHLLDDCLKIAGTTETAINTILFGKEVAHAPS